MREGHIVRVPVRRGMSAGQLSEVLGPLAATDLVVARGREDLADGQVVVTHDVTPSASASE